MGLRTITSRCSTNRHAARSFVPPIEAIGNSLLFAASPRLLAAILGLLAAQVIAYRRGRLAAAFDALLTLPLGTSAVILGFGFLISLGSLPIDLRSHRGSSRSPTPWSHCRSSFAPSTPVMRSLDRRLHEAAAVLGASPSRAWREVDLPIIGRALLIGAGFAFAVSLGEFGATLFIVRPDMPDHAHRHLSLLGQPGTLAFGQAMAMATLLMLAVTAVAALIIRPCPRRRSAAS